MHAFVLDIRNSRTDRALFTLWASEAYQVYCSVGSCAQYPLIAPLMFTSCPELCPICSLSQGVGTLNTLSICAPSIVYLQEWQDKPHEQHDSEQRDSSNQEDESVLSAH
jgi:hypothetical protein